MANLGADEIRKTVRDVEWLIVDANGVEVSLNDLANVGDATWNIPEVEETDILERNQFQHRRKGKDLPWTVDMTLNELNSTDTARAALLDILFWGKVTTSYAYLNLVPTNGSAPDVPQWTLRRKVEGTTHGDTADHQINFLQGKIKMAGGADGDPNSIKIHAEGYTFSMT